MKHSKKRIFASATATCALFAAVILPADASAAGTPVIEFSESVTDYDLQDDTTVSFQKDYPAFNITVKSSTKAEYAEVTMDAIRPFTFLGNGKTLFDQLVSHATIALPLVENYYSYTLTSQNLNLAAGDVAHFTVKLYSLVNGQKVYQDPAPGSYLSFSGCEILSAPSEYQDFYLSCFSSSEAAYADVTLTVNSLKDGYYLPAATSTEKVSLTKNHGCIKLTPAQLKFSSGDALTLSYTFYDKNGNVVSGPNAGTETALLSSKPGVPPGDINGDGSVTKKDIVCMQDFLSNTPENEPVQSTGLCLRTADLNCDGRISCKDLTILKNLLLVS